MTIFEDWPAWVAFVTIIAAYAIGNLVGRLNSLPPLPNPEPLSVYTRAELRGFTLGLLTAFVAIHNKAGPPSRSPPVSGTGQRLNPGQPTHSPPVAGAGGETG